MITTKYWEALICFGVLAILVAGVPVSSQPQSHVVVREPLALTRLTPELRKKLELQPEQIAKLDDLLVRQRTDLKLAFSRRKPEAHKQAIAAVRRSEQQADALLTPSQRPLWATLQKDYREWSPLGRLALPLLVVSGLSEAQRTQLQSLVAARGPSLAVIRDRPYIGPPGPLQERLGTWETETNVLIRKILKQRQQQQYDDALKSLHSPM